MKSQLLLISFLAYLTLGCKTGEPGCITTETFAKNAMQLCNFKYQESFVQANNITDVTITSPSLIWTSSVNQDGSTFDCSSILTHSYYPGSIIRPMFTQPVTQNLNSLQCSVGDKTLTIHGIIDGTYGLFTSKIIVFYVDLSNLEFSCSKHA